jgi:hypothetical protein
MTANAAAFPQMAHDQLPWLAALAELVDAVPQELIVLEPTQYAALIASVACIKAMVTCSNPVGHLVPYHFDYAVTTTTRSS